LQQVWANIIYNAIQAMPHQGTMTITIATQADTVRILIADNGNGIPSPMIAHVFDPFFTTKTAGEGSGLGLTIVKKIIECHQGAIAISSDHSGTIVRVTLPLSQPSLHQTTTHATKDSQLS
jgi:two-component system, NtrC family, sensor kinase